MKRLACSTAALFVLMTHSAEASDFGHVKSGMLLGIYARPENGGMQVLSTIPGYSAEGRLFPGDVLLRATVDGFQIHRLRSHYETENAKLAIGPHRQAAIEVWRPGVGLIYAWVEFTPIGGIQLYSTHGAVPTRAQFRMESERPGARRMFHRGGEMQTPPAVMPRIPSHGSGPMFSPFPSNGLQDPGRLFR